MGNGTKSLAETPRGGEAIKSGSHRPRLLLVDDDPGQVELALAGLGGSQGALEAMVVGTLAAARQAEKEFEPEIALVSATLSDGHGMELLPGDFDSASYPIVIMMSPGEEHLAAEAIKLGAIDYLVKSDLASSNLLHLVRRVLREWEVTLENKRSSVALRRSEERFRATFEQGAVGFAHLSLDGRFIWVNEALCRIVGYSREELLSLDNARLVHPEKRKEFEDGRIRLVGQEIENVSRPVRYLKKNGETLWTSVTLSLVRGEDGKPSYCVAVVQDISEQREAQRERVKLAAAIEQSDDAVMVLDTAGVVEYVNPAFERITGDDRADLVGRTPAILRRGKHDERFYAELWRTIQRQESWMGRLVDINKLGKKLVVEARLDSIVDSGGKVIGYIGILRDVTEQTKLEQTLRQAHKMEAIGTLAGGIAHDFNNILYAIGGFIELAQLSEHASGSDAPRYLDEAFKATERAKQLVSQILAFSRKTEQEKRPVRFDLLVKEISRLLRATIPSTIRIETHLDVHEPLVSADPSQLHQIVMNLCTNAAHAMREHGGLLEIALETGDFSPTQPPIMRLLVRDTGVGMSKETQKRVFEPFFTTKPAGEGTGMGLSVVQGIVESLGGTIGVSSEPGVGTTFRVELPLSQEGQGPAQPKHQERRFGIAPGKRALVVDDEPDITEIMAAILGRAGFEIDTASDGEEAWRLYREDERGFDVIISDQTMPGMTGGELAQKILEADPNQAIILCTGYSEKLTEDEADRIGIKQLLFKPVRNKNLLEAVEKALGPP